jgi:hypothetical protein
MNRNLTKNTQALSKTLLAAAIVLIVTAAAIGAAYYLINSSNPQTDPAGSGTDTIQDFFSSANPYEDYKTTSEYTIKYYDQAHQNQTATMFENISEESYGGVSCWKIVDALSTSTGTTSFHTMHVAKADVQAIHYSLIEYVAGNVTRQEDYDVSSTQKMIGFLLTQRVDPQSITGREDVKVDGETFTNCARAEIIDGQQTIYVWTHRSIAGWGIVKMEIYNQQNIVMTMELAAPD